jgi:hypothetical protein
MKNPIERKNPQIVNVANGEKAVLWKVLTVMVTLILTLIGCI